MSKMSQLHAELSEQAYELGFESIGEAEQAGYGVDWEKRKLIPPVEAAHKALVLEKKEVLRRLDLVVARSQYDKTTIKLAKSLIEQEIK